MISAINDFDIVDKKGFDEFAVDEAICKSKPQKNKEDLTVEELAEILAFGFVEDYEDKETGWGTYFGPKMVFNNGNGTITEVPSMSLLTPEIIDHYIKRSNQCVNPILSARYAGLAWDFHLKICKFKPSHEIATAYIIGLIKIANEDYLGKDQNTFQKLKRALELSVSLKKNELILEAKYALMNYEKRNITDDRPGMWGHCFDLLIGNKKIFLTAEEEDEIILQLENKLCRIIAEPDPGKRTPDAAEYIVDRLATYYFAKNRIEEVKRVLGELDAACYRSCQNKSPMQVAHWLQKLHTAYVKYNLNEEANTILVKLRELGPDIADQLKSIPFQFEIERSSIDKVVEALLNGNADTILASIAGQFVPKKADAFQEMMDTSKKSPLASFFNTQIQESDGRVVANLKSLKDDPDGNLIHHIAQGLQFSFIFLGSVLQEGIVRDKINLEVIMEFSTKTPIIKLDRFPIINKALKAYFDQDYIVFMHLIIPQIEDAIRNVIEVSAGNVLKVARSGGQQLRTFDDMLRDEILLQKLGEDFTTYFKVLFTDQRGWNLRNKVCHGMIGPKSFHRQTADRVLHAFLCVAIIREAKV